MEDVSLATMQQCNKQHKPHGTYTEHCLQLCVCNGYYNGVTEDRHIKDKSIVMSLKVFSSPS